LARETFALVCANRKLGIAIAARIPIIATTISNSISVNPMLYFFIVYHPVFVRKDRHFLAPVFSHLNGYLRLDY
jgi:hypothetical protein